ncbi:MAG: TusE/DsrC/DsvC family sulfur relay protein [Ardenticatenaceae bacterium]|nr:TusE/DsrC/DsvC family sulfur relay protein [Anaerolineales bacterium]MCB8939834.1 TusE/DsrC/DsvC family sulfur relay protein [Ardenticatenaceae bacterium]MCB8975084.1 TusE/DsrC/DsvC family sulfur relay protein [Ardenticatenaceae bacterium]
MSTNREIAGKLVEFDDDGFMANAQDWNEQIAEELATDLGITPLSEDHWKVIRFCRDDFSTQGDAPTLRRITKVGGVSTKDLYQLFPKGPAKKVAYVAGLKKPSGCI